MKDQDGEEALWGEICQEIIAALCGLRANGFDLEAEIEALKSRPVFEAPAGDAAAAPQVAPPPSRPRPRKRRDDWTGTRRDWVRR